MATAEQYADWIVRNADKKGSPEFETVAAAYKAAKPQQASISAGEFIRGVPRQVGLFARSAAQAVGSLPGLIVDPITGAMNAAADLYDEKRAPTMSELVTGKQRGARIPTLRAGMDAALNDLGLPKPANADERTVGTAVETGLGAATMVKAAQKAGEVVSGGAKKVLETMAANPITQVVGGVGAGAAGGAVKEAGGGPVEQFIASLAGGVGAGMAAQGASGMAQKAGNALSRILQKPEIRTQQAEQQIILAMERSGMDWKSVPENIRRGLIQEVSDALNTGQPLNADAIRRLMVFRQAKVTPTVGQLTQDPGMITREQNLSRTGANSTNANLQRLPQLQNQNVASLLAQLDELGAARAPDAMGAGRAATDALLGREAIERARINALYTQARDSQGRSLPLNHGVFNQRVSQLLDEANVGSFLPADIRNKLNAMAEGRPGFELTVDAAEQLKTSIGNLQRNSADGNVRTALGLVRQALDETPLMQSPRVNPGNLPAVPGTVPPSAQVAGQESIDAFNAARSANRAWMQRVEKNPALKAVVDGVEPDQFVNRFIIGKGASAADVRALRKELTPDATEALKQYIVRYLKDRATNSTDDITKFSQDAYRRALRDIGDEKLAVFFSKEELQQLKVLGEAAKYMQAQPAGSAVNNSNSGALVLGRGLDWLDTIAERAPVGFRDVIKGTIAGQQQTQVLNPQNALIQLTRPQPRGIPFNPLLAATIPAPVQSREDDRRR